MELSKMEVREPCIYRVPSQIRNVKPEAYTPRMVVIGPLHRSPKSTAKDGPETSSNPWHLRKEYLQMEVTKNTYLKSFTQIVGEDTIEEMRKIIQAEEKNIRDSYDEPAEWIPSEYYVDLILLDSVFIMEFALRAMQYCEYSDDKIVDQPLYASVVIHDLMLLENQLPYFILHSLFRSSMMELYIHEAFDQLIDGMFGLIRGDETNYKHFTDILRCLYEDSLPNSSKIRTYPGCFPNITELRNADKLSQAGVDCKIQPVFGFQSSYHEEHIVDVGDVGVRRFLRTMTFMDEKRPGKKRSIKSLGNFSLDVWFAKGSLWMPEFHANEEYDMYLRNVIAYEQCHVAVTPFTSNYIHFLNFLITSNRDVELLREAGVVTSTMGRPSFVVDMVNKLQVGVKVGNSSQYHLEAMRLKAHYKSRRKMCWATLRKVYFSDLWTGTATLAAVLLLLLTLVGTVASVIQAYKSF